MNTCKILLLGEVGVGKSSLARRLVFKEFRGEFRSTIGVDILTYDIPNGPGGEPFKFLIWDTDGSFGQSFLDTVYMQGAHAALLIGDVSRANTVASLAALAHQFDSKLPGRFSAVILNKVDLLGEGEEVQLPDRLVTPMRKAVRTSAKTGEGVIETFEEAAATIVRRGLLT